VEVNMDIYIARQPIFDNKYNVIAYELLYRNNEGNFFNGNISDNVATSILLINSYFNFGIKTLVGEYKVFINFDSHLIKSDIAQLLNKDKVVIEILESVKPDKKLLNKIRKLNELGYTIAVDDYTTDYKYNEITNLCNIVKVDFMENTREGIESLVKELKRSGKILLAEKVETKEEFEWAKFIGFDYYQGFYFSRPSLRKGKALPENAVQYVRLMNELNTPEPKFRVLSDIIGLDISLTYKLLKLVNSNPRLQNEITSIQQAIAILGVNELTRWLSLAMVQDISKQETHEAVRYAMIRSNLLKEIALHSNLKNSVEELSLLGTLSIVDTVLEISMDEALKSIPISKEMKDTLLDKNTMYSDAMKLCFAYERGVFNDIHKSACNINYDVKLLSGHYIDSVKWADEMFEEIKNNF
jgi:EAL and modified HD-GYP domain-containing signal transduction protein